MKKICIMSVALFLLLSGICVAAETEQSGNNSTSDSSTPEAMANETAKARQAENIVPADYEETGFASWYGEKFHGKLTASGEKFNMNKYTAAHNYLPLGVKVRVTNIENGKSVVVRINDRGPFVPDRIIDISRVAGEKIGIIDSGKSKVKIEAYRPKPKPEVKKREIIPASAPKDIYGAFYVQVGAFKVKNNADILVERLEKNGFRNHRMLRIVTDSAQVFKVQIGMYKSLSKARKVLGTLGKGFPGAFVMADVIQE